jgi:TonB-linked SusC/RagA family outer membrane protein
MFQFRMMSYFGRVNYALMSKYLIEMNIRADASSRFAKGNRWGYFPSFSAGWRLGEEPFVKNLNLFDNLKLRASWGKLGNQNIGSASNSDYFPYLTVITQDYGTSYNFNNSLVPGAAVTALVDPNITWETSTTTDIGIDIGILNNRLNIEADYFLRKTEGIIVSLPIPRVLGGLTAPRENVGEMENKGLELNVNWQDRVASSGFSYSIGANLTYLDNNVTKFRGKDSPDQLRLIREGYSYESLYGYIFEGIYQSDAEASQHMHSNGYRPVAGDIRYKDVNGDGRIDYQDKEGMGNIIPKYTYGINANLGWKNFDLTMQFAGVAGLYQYNQSAWTTPLGISGGTITKRWLDAYTPQKPSTTMPIIKLNDTWNRQQSSFWVQDLSWFKLKNIQLGYALPRELANKLSLQRLYMYINTNDLIVLTKKDFEGFDPEQNVRGTNYDPYPVPRIYTFGLNITF